MLHESSNGTAIERTFGCCVYSILLSAHLMMLLRPWIIFTREFPSETAGLAFDDGLVCKERGEEAEMKGRSHVDWVLIIERTEDT